MANNPKIKNGFFNAFYAFKLFDSKGHLDNKQYIKVLESLRDAGIMISADNPDNAIYFMSGFNDTLIERKKEYRKYKEEKKQPPIYLDKSITKISEKPKVYVAPTEKGIRIELEDDLVDDLHVSQDYYLHQLIDIYHDEEKYTGIPTKEYKNRFLLFPPLIKDKKQQYFHPGIYLTVFKHGYAILWISFELEDTEFDEINLNGWCLNIDTAYFPEFMINDNKSHLYKKKARCADINSLLKEYGNFIYRAANNEEPKLVGQYFYHLVLTDFAYMVERYNDKLNNKFNETMYKLLFAPMPDYLLKSQNEIEEFLNTRFYSNSMYLRLYANNNRTISAFTKDNKKALRPYLPVDADLNDSEGLNYLYQKISVGGIINSIESLLLKKETIQNLLVFELNESTSQKKLINLLIRENMNYSVEFSKYFYTYGSVRDQLQFLEKSCEGFLQTKLMDERKEKLEKVISLKKDRYVTNFTAIGPVLTILLTLFLSFPTLDSIFQKLNKESLLLPTYFILNLFFIMFFLYVTREQTVEIVKDVKNNLIPNTKKKYLNFATRCYIKFYDLAVFFNLEYKVAMKILFLQTKNFFYERVKLSKLIRNNNS